MDSDQLLGFKKRIQKHKVWIIVGVLVFVAVIECFLLYNRLRPSNVCQDIAENVNATKSFENNSIGNLETNK